jgi:hypothetical protein
MSLGSVASTRIPKAAARSATDHEHRLAAQLDQRQPRFALPPGRHLLVEALDVAGQVEQQRHGVVADLRPLDDLRVGEHHLRSDDLRDPHEILDTGAGALDPLQVLGARRQRIGEATPHADRGVAVHHVHRDLAGVGRGHEFEVRDVFHEIGERIREIRQNQDADRFLRGRRRRQAYGADDNNREQHRDAGS